MDTTDKDITFDAEGVCCHCRKADSMLLVYQPSPETAETNLDAIVSRIKSDQKKSKYDSVIGLSGGVDSTYLAYLAHSRGLRPLIVHFDNGWNSEIAISNIRKTVEVLGLEYETYVIDWKEFRSIQRAFINASVVDIELITDYGIASAIQHIAKKRGIKHILRGANYTTEHGMPASWSWQKSDFRNIAGINKLFGEVPLKTYPRLSWWNRNVPPKLQTIVDPTLLLNSIFYKKTEAMETLREELDWKDYGGKHYESRFTKFYQAHILPTKFGVDKRKVHLSALIRNGETTREAALEELSRPLYDPDELQEDTEFVLKKLGFSQKEFGDIMKMKPVPHDHYPSWKDAQKRKDKIKNALRPLIPDRLWRSLRTRLYG